MEYKTAFITGSSSGIGEGLARRLARRGVHVGLAARREDRLRAIADDIEASGGRASVFPLDVSDPDVVTQTVQRADDELGGLDLVVANAGVTLGRWGGKATYDQFAKVIDVNVRGAAATLVAVLPRMVERKRGHIVGVSSLAKYRATPKMASYSASKAFLATFLEGLRIDLQSVPIHVTDIRPGFVKTDIVDGMKSMPFLIEVDQAVDYMERGILARRRVVEFPPQMAAIAHGMGVVPPALWDVATRKGR